MWEPSKPSHQATAPGGFPESKAAVRCIQTRISHLGFALVLQYEHKKCFHVSECLFVLLLTKYSFSASKVLLVDGFCTLINQSYTWPNVIAFNISHVRFSFSSNSLTASSSRAHIPRHEKRFGPARVLEYQSWPTVDWLPWVPHPDRPQPTSVLSSGCQGLSFQKGLEGAGTAAAV